MQNDFCNSTVSAKTQAIIEISANLLSTGPSETKLSEILIVIKTEENEFVIYHLCPLCLGLYVLTMLYIGSVRLLFSMLISDKYADG